MTWNPKIFKQSVAPAASHEACNVHCHSQRPTKPEPETKPEFTDEFKNLPPPREQSSFSKVDASRRALVSPLKPSWKHRLGDLCLDFLLTLKEVPERRPWERKPVRD